MRTPVIAGVAVVVAILLVRKRMQPAPRPTDPPRLDFGGAVLSAAGLGLIVFGILQSSKDWTASRAANVPIGQGISVTTLQLASVYQTIANGGVRIPPRIVKSETAHDGTVTQEPQPEGTRVISEATAASMAYMLESVTSAHGTPAAEKPSRAVSSSAWRDSGVMRLRRACAIASGLPSPLSPSWPSSMLAVDQMA